MSIAMHQIIDRLWLGDMAGAYNKILLKKNKITHILTVAEGISPKFPAHFSYKIIRILDSPQANIKQYFSSCIQYIRECLSSPGCGILVHCYAGVSRSASVVIAYLMQELGMSYQDATLHVKRQRYFICPNDGFKRQLQQFAKELKRNGANSQKRNQIEAEGDEQGVILAHGQSMNPSSTYSGGFGLGGTQKISLGSEGLSGNQKHLMMRTLQSENRATDRVMGGSLTRDHFKQRSLSKGGGPIFSQGAAMINNGFSGVSGMYLDGRFGLLSTVLDMNGNLSSGVSAQRASVDFGQKPSSGFHGSPTKFIAQFKSPAFKAHTNHLISGLQTHNSYFSKSNGFKVLSSLKIDSQNTMNYKHATLPNFNQSSAEKAKQIYNNNGGSYSLKHNLNSQTHLPSNGQQRASSQGPQASGLLLAKQQQQMQQYPQLFNINKPTQLHPNGSLDTQQYQLMQHQTKQSSKTVRTISQNPQLSLKM